MPSAIDIFVSYKFLKQLSTPWTEWEAYELGLIDDKGKTIRKPTTPAERDAFPKWKVLIRNIKTLLDKLPFGKSRLGSFAGALYLLKEEMKVDLSVLEERFLEYINQEKLVVESENGEKINMLDKGRYKHVDGKAIFLKESVEPVATVFGTPVFQVTDYITGTEYTLIADDLERF